MKNLGEYADTKDIPRKEDIKEVKMIVDAEKQTVK